MSPTVEMIASRRSDIADRTWFNAAGNLRDDGRIEQGKNA